MWAYLPIVSLLIRAIIGSSETGSTLSDVTRLQNGSNDIVYQRSEKSTMDTSKEWKEGSFKTERKKTETTTDNIVSDETKNNFNDVENSKSVEYDRGTDSKIVVKKREITGMNFDRFVSNKQFPESFLKNGILFDYCRLIHVQPFYNLGGKRGNPFSRSNVPATGKRDKFTYDRDDRDNVDGYDVKRIADNRRIKYPPFNSWGGKRAEKTNEEQEPFVVIVRSISDNGHSRNWWKCEKRVQRKNTRGKPVTKTMQREHRAPIDTEKATTFFYGNPLYENDETNGKDYTTQEAYTDVDWVMSMPEKRESESFYPWGGKRSPNTQDFRFGDDYFNELAPSAKGRKVFFPWGG
ncbi:uncharacterized protein LOC143150472 [Ptiloglossa arizonensis]|uniref:uncharacterized protein LOC143150472 n=1 Tax=Ptiloglossa arizonensis TaxID=3350558 RepID=UPI003FA16924